MSPPYGVVHRIVTGRWYPFTNLYDDYKTAPLIDKIRIRGIGKITDEYIVPKRPAKTRKGWPNGDQNWDIQKKKTL